MYLFLFTVCDIKYIYMCIMHTYLRLCISLCLTHETREEDNSYDWLALSPSPYREDVTLS